MIRVESLSKRYWIYRHPLERLWDWTTPRGWQRGQPFWALRDIGFEVAGGTSMGIVGVNGAGKSTLLKVLTGTTQPTEGTFQIEGRVSSLLELGTGFHPEFTGRQNLRLGARMAGLTQEELDSRFDRIVDFAELGSFVDQPVRMYSSGMALRLGFALASSVDPDVLIIDEALSVGDLHFQHKCLRRMREFHERGTTVLFVSHDPSMVKKFCDEAILLDGGRMIDRGRPDQVLDYYTALLAERYREGGGRARIVRPDGISEMRAEEAMDNGEAADSWEALAPLEGTGHRTGNFDAVITSVYLAVEGAHANTRVLPTGTEAELRVRWVALTPIEQATVGIMIRDRLGQEVYGINTAYREVAIEGVEPEQTVEVAFALKLNLGEGLYSVTAAIHAGEDHTETCYDWVDLAMTFQITPDPTERFTGLIRLPTEIHVRRERSPAEELAHARKAREAGRRASLP